jgi:hypothetical protein
MAGMKLLPDMQHKHQLPNHYLWIRPSVTPSRIDDELLLSFLAVRGVQDLSFRQIKAILTEPDILYRILVHHFGFHPKFRYGDLFFMTEQLPNPDSRVRLSDKQVDRYGYPVAQIDWQFTTDELHKFETYTKLLFSRGLVSTQYEVVRWDAMRVWDRYVSSAAHHMGTARMAGHPSRGVVDSNLCVFDMVNLYICDGSVFPTAGSVNPSLTITALGLRLAEALVASERPFTVKT